MDNFESSPAIVQSGKDTMGSAMGGELHPSKYNPVERCWGILEQHWNGTKLTDAETMLKWANTMTQSVSRFGSIAGASD
jgi:hypothetical protein